eukprot:Lithocolla_globosa_v1_NODE_368_length_4282_cov_1393.917909.p1 type:complete len:874 gc:universal NODE_368_length_4282_cov_1393.917909:3941-1320(-)
MRNAFLWLLIWSLVMASLCWINGCDYSALSKSDILFHVKVAHENGRDLLYVCSDCPLSYAKLNSFRHHTARHHPTYTSEQVMAGLHFEQKTAESCNDLFDCPGVFDDESQESGEEKNEDVLHSGHEDIDDDFDEMTRATKVFGTDFSLHAGKYLLNLKEGKALTQETLDEIVSETSTLAQVVGVVIQKRLQDRIQLMEEVTVDSIEELINDPSMYDVNLFENLKTAAKQKSFYKKRFGFQEPTPVKLGTQEVWKVIKGNNTLIERQDIGFVFDFAASLDRRLSNDHYREDFFKPKQSSDGKIRDVCDGSTFKNHPLFTHKPDGAQVQLYYDDFEVTNPLSSKTHKLGMFYTLNTNESIEYRSRLESIEVVAIAKTEHIRKYPQAVSLLLNNFVSVMKELGSEEGLYLPKANLTIWGALLEFVGDTLASQFVGGFKEGVGFALRKCRNCLATATDMNTHFCEADFILRNHETHSRHCELVEGPNGKFWSTTFGVTLLSCLNDCPFFDVTTMMRHDVAHIVLEGFWPDELNMFLKYCVKEAKFFSVEDFNFRLAAFPLSSFDKVSKPTPLKKPEKKGQKYSRQNASQNWLLSRMLPLLIQDWVPDDDRHWMSMKAHCAILKMTLKQEYDDIAIEVLDETVDYHHRLYKVVYPFTNITPKGHYYVHFGSSIRRSGPPRRGCSLRYEGRHRFFKRLGVISNWKNLPFTLGTRYQLWMCNLYLKIADEHPNIKGPKFKLGKLTRSSKTQVDFFDKTHAGFGEVGSLQILTTLAIFGTEFRPGSVVPCSTKRTQDLREYCVIKSIMVRNHRYFFEVELLETVSFDERVLMFWVTETGARDIRRVGDFDTKTSSSIWYDNSEPSRGYVSDKNWHPRFSFF